MVLAHTTEVVIRTTIEVGMVMMIRAACDRDPARVGVAAPCLEIMVVAIEGAVARSIQVAWLAGRQGCTLRH